MSSVKDIGSVLEGQSRRILLTLILVAALLLCHGLYGAMHQVFATLHASPALQAHMPHTDTHGSGGGEHTPIDRQDEGGGEGQGHLGHVAYAAALLVISLGAILWLLGGGRAWTRSDLSSLTKRIVPPKFLRPPLIPNPALLQVFRL